jgi:hypothetical protein
MNPKPARSMTQVLGSGTIAITDWPVEQGVSHLGCRDASGRQDHALFTMLRRVRMPTGLSSAALGSLRP